MGPEDFDLTGPVEMIVLTGEGFVSETPDRLWVDGYNVWQAVVNTALPEQETPSVDAVSIGHVSITIEFLEPV